MALSRAIIDSGTVTANGPTVGPFTPASGSVVYVLAAIAAQGGGTTETTDSLTIDVGTTGLTFSRIDANTQVYGGRRALLAYRGTAASPASGSLTITATFSVGTFAAMSYAVIEYTGHNAGTPNDALVQSTDIGDASPLDVGSIGTVDAGDEVLTIAGHENAANSLAVTGGTPLFEGGEASHLRAFLVAASTDSTPNITWGSNGATAGMAFIVNVAAAGNVSIEVPAGSLSAVGLAATVLIAGAVTIAGQVGAIAATGYAPTVTVNTHTTISVPAGSLTASGQFVSVAFGGPGAGVLTATGYAPTVSLTDLQTVAPGAGSLAVTGLAPVLSVVTPGTMEPGAGSLTVTGQAPSLGFSWVITPPAGSLVFQGRAPGDGSLSANRSMQQRGRGRGR